MKPSSLHTLCGLVRRGSRTLALGATCFTLAATASAQVVTAGTISVSAGGSLQSGDRAAFERALRQAKDGYGGIEQFSLNRWSDNGTLRFDARALPGNDEYRLNFYWERSAAYYVSANYHEFVVRYDGSGGRIVPRNLDLPWFDEQLGLKRSYLTVEAGTLRRDAANWKLRYERQTRHGAKSSIRWGDSNLAAPEYSPRAIIPAMLLPDEARDIVTLEGGRRTDAQAWRVLGRYQHTVFANRHVGRRRATEAADRYDVVREGNDSTALTGLASYERNLSPQWRVAAGGLVTDIDNALSGSRIYSPDSSGTLVTQYPRSQPGDGGYLDLSGDSRLRQYLANASLNYRPNEHWTIVPALKYEHLRKSVDDAFTETSMTGVGAVLTQRPVAALARELWDEATADLEIRHARWRALRLSARAQWNEGEGSIVEQSILQTTGAFLLNRDSTYQRSGQRYFVNASWQASPTFAVSFRTAYRLKQADYRGRVDSTSNAALSTNRDRYPQYIIDQDLESLESTVRASWRPRPGVMFETRYAQVQAHLTATMDGLPEIENGRLERHALTQTVFWQPAPRFYVHGALHVNYDQLQVPRHLLTVPGRNDYTQAALTFGYALDQSTDVRIEANQFRAGNPRANEALTLPVNSAQRTRSAFLTWVRRQTAKCTYTVRYGFADQRDDLMGGLNNYRAHLLESKVQYAF